MQRTLPLMTSRGMGSCFLATVSVILINSVARVRTW